MRIFLLASAFVMGCTTSDMFLDEEEHVPAESPCVVTRIDEATGIRTNRYSFSSHGLLSHHWRSTPNTYGVRANRWVDGALVSATVEQHFAADDTAWDARWVTPWVVYDQDAVVREDHRFAYDAAGRLVSWENRHHTRVGAEDYRSVRLVQTTYDEAGRKLTEQQYDANDRPMGGHRSQQAAQTTRAYHYLDGRLAAIDTNASYARYRVRFLYDEQRRLLDHVGDDEKSVYQNRYDERGRLVSTGGGGIDYVWNDADQIIEQRLGRRVTFEYRSGRLDRADLGELGSYRQTYSDSCPVGFSHPLITPNVLYRLHYEGPPDHHTWSSY